MGVHPSSSAVFGFAPALLTFPQFGNDRSKMQHEWVSFHHSLSCQSPHWLKVTPPQLDGAPFDMQHEELNLRHP